MAKRKQQVFQLRKHLYDSTVNQTKLPAELPSDFVFRVMPNFAKMLSEISANPHMATADWKSYDSHLCLELTRVTSNHLCSAVPFKKAQSTFTKGCVELKKQRARELVQAAVSNGTLAKPNRCSTCHGKTPADMLHAHHVDYKKPLDVEWLCTKCHSDRHSTKKDITLTPVSIAR